MKKILIVDDNQDNRTTLKLLLDEFEHLDISEAQDGMEAVKLCASNRFDIVFMDIMMPVMNGIEATREIRLFDKNVMIVAASALGDDENKRSILEVGAEDYITKPINPDLFSKRAQNYLRLVDLRRLRDHDASSINLFGIPVYSRSVIFNIKKESSLAEFWEFYLIDYAQGADNLSDCVRCIYNIGLEMLKTHRYFRIIVEEDDKTFYFSLLHLKSFNAVAIKDIINKEFSEAKYLIEDGQISINAAKQRLAAPVATMSKESKKELEEVLGMDQEELGILRKTHFNKISAQEYISELAMDFIDKLEELEVLEESADSTIYEYETEKDIAAMGRLAGSVKEYSSVIDSLYEFKHLAFAINSLGDFLTTVTNELLDDKKIKALGLLLRSIFEDLTQWRKTVFIDKTTADIHYLDSSLLSSCLQIELLLKKEGTADVDDELELF